MVLKKMTKWSLTYPKLLVKLMEMQSRKQFLIMIKLENIPLSIPNEIINRNRWLCHLSSDTAVDERGKIHISVRLSNRSDINARKTEHTTCPTHQHSNNQNCSGRELYKRFCKHCCSTHKYRAHKGIQVFWAPWFLRTLVYWALLWFFKQLPIMKLLSTDELISMVPTWSLFPSQRNRWNIHCSDLYMRYKANM